MHAKKPLPVLFSLTFHPFFLGASFFAILSIAYWLGFNQGIFQLNHSTISPFQWHAHEMIYGYSLATLAGFLLTAVKNRTGKQTPHGFPLVILFSLWAIARALWLFNKDAIFFAAFFDLIFIIFLIMSVAYPIIISKQWPQIAILSNIIILGIGNLIFYLSALGYIENAIQLAIYGGLYLIIGVILTIGRQIITLFVTSGFGYSLTLFSSRLLDISSLFFFLCFFISEVFLHSPLITQCSAALMVIITTIRIIGWYTPEIWKSPLLWCFYISLFFIDFGFLLFALSAPYQISPFLAVHAFSVGGIGIISMGMMARISIGHTGRGLKKPSSMLLCALICLTLAAIVRTIIPSLTDYSYFMWVNISGCLWLLSFIFFYSAFLPKKVQPSYPP